MARLRAVTARVVHFQPETLENFLTGLQAVVDGFAVLDSHATALVERELRIDEVPMIRDEPADAVAAGVAALLVRLEDQYEIPVGFVVFFPVADQVGDECGRHVLVIGRAPAVKITVSFHQLEWICCPVLALRFDYIDVSHQQDRLTLARAVESRYQVATLGSSFEHVDVVIGEAGGLQPGRHRLRGLIGIAHGRRGVDLDELLVNLVREALLIIEDVGLCGGRERAPQQKEGTGHDESDWTYSG